VPGADAADLPTRYSEWRERGGLPLVIQDEPAATGVALSLDLLRKCIEAAAARTVKLEAPPTAPKIAALLATDPGLHVFGGLGGAYALAELRAGACGTMTGFAFPEIMAAIRSAAHANEWSRAAALYDRFLPLIQFEALRRRGVISSARCRRDPTEIDEITRRELDGLLARLGIVPATEPLRVRES
jgi:4-hydroxy-tetrahydrodipicolinate synthase